MNEQHQQILEQHADNMRFILDLVCTMLDGRNSDTTRGTAAFDLMDREELFPALSAVREVFRSIANERTDKHLAGRATK